MFKVTNTPAVGMSVFALAGTIVVCVLGITAIHQGGGEVTEEMTLNEYKDFEKVSPDFPQRRQYDPNLTLQGLHEHADKCAHRDPVGQTLDPAPISQSVLSRAGSQDRLLVGYTHHYMAEHIIYHRPRPRGYSPMRII